LGDREQRSQRENRAREHERENGGRDRRSDAGNRRDINEEDYLSVREEYNMNQ
jgi:hypothetical protein